MAITRTLTRAIPTIVDGKAECWDLYMTYEQGTGGTYYKEEFEEHISCSTAEVLDGNGLVIKKVISSYTSKAAADFTRSELEALCPTAKWDEIFNYFYDKKITNPPVPPVKDLDFVLPE